MAGGKDAALVLLVSDAGTPHWRVELAAKSFGAPVEELRLSVRP